jgi:hypothetical protein
MTVKIGRENSNHCDDSAARDGAFDPLAPDLPADPFIACDSAEAGSKFEVRVAGQAVRSTVPGTGGWSKYEELDLGPVMIRKPGDFELEIHPIKMAHGGLMNLKTVKLVPE